MPIVLNYADIKNYQVRNIEKAILTNGPSDVHLWTQTKVSLLASQNFIKTRG